MVRRMDKYFNVTGTCVPEKHYMVNLDERISVIRDMVDNGDYFAINRGRQYGKTTTLQLLYKNLLDEYYVVPLDFQALSSSDYENENVFCTSFGKLFVSEFRLYNDSLNGDLLQALLDLEMLAENHSSVLLLKSLFGCLGSICVTSDRPIVLMIDEVDTASNNQIFLDFLAQLRRSYLKRDQSAAFHSVILAGVYDVKSLKMKFRPKEGSALNNPWNIAVSFNVDMNFSQNQIREMLDVYETDKQTGMDVLEMAHLIYEYTAGYPYLVSDLCKYMDEEIAESKAWTAACFQKAVKMVLMEQSPLFESLIRKIVLYPELNRIVQTVLFRGKAVSYNPDNEAIALASMFGFVKNEHGKVKVANRIFETRLYNYYLSSFDMLMEDITDAADLDSHQFVMNGHLNVRHILERFVVHFNDLYGDRGEAFAEEEGRKFFLLYLQPISNGTGHYYVEARTRDRRRTDVIIDYAGEQHVIEMKIWRGNEYNTRGEKQLMDYLDAYHLETGYMLSFNFNKNKVPGVNELRLGDKVLIEAVV